MLMKVKYKLYHKIHRAREICNSCRPWGTTTQNIGRIYDYVFLTVQSKIFQYEN